MSVSVRMRFAALSDTLDRRSSPVPRAPRLRASSQADLTWPMICGSPSTWGVQAGSHTDQVPCGILVPVTVGGAPDFIDGHGPVVGEPLGQGRFVGRIDDAIDFGSVAGREDGRFGHARDSTGNGHQGAAEHVGRKRNPVPQVQCGGAVVDAVCQYRHFERSPSVLGVTMNCNRGLTGQCPGPRISRWPIEPRTAARSVRWLAALLLSTGCAQLPVETGPADFRVEGKVGRRGGGAEPCRALCLAADRRPLRYRVLGAARTGQHAVARRLGPYRDHRRERRARAVGRTRHGDAPAARLEPAACGVALVDVGPPGAGWGR